jgi:hypothetical protein
LDSAAPCTVKPYAPPSTKTKIAPFKLSGQRVPTETVRSFLFPDSAKGGQRTRIMFGFPGCWDSLRYWAGAGDRDYFVHSSVMSSNFGLGGIEYASRVPATLLNSTSVLHWFPAQEIEDRKIHRHHSVGDGTCPYRVNSESHPPCFESHSVDST